MHRKKMHSPYFFLNDFYAYIYFLLIITKIIFSLKQTMVYIV